MTFTPEELQAEEWRQVPGYDNRYEVSNLGRVRARFIFRKGKPVLRTRTRFLRFSGNKGYPMVCFVDGAEKRTLAVHRLVASLFLGPPPDPSWHAAHLDGNRKNCRASNLAWKTRSENEQDKLIHGTAIIGAKNHNTKLTEAQVRAARILTKECRLSCGRVGELFDVSSSTIHGAVCGKTWKHIPDDASEDKLRARVAQLETEEARTFDACLQVPAFKAADPGGEAMIADVVRRIGERAEKAEAELAKVTSERDALKSRVEWLEHENDLKAKADAKAWKAAEDRADAALALVKELVGALKYSDECRLRLPGDVNDKTRAALARAHAFMEGAK